MGVIEQQQLKQKYRYKDSEKFAGAIKKEKYVLAFEPNMTWKLAQILEVRYELPFDNDAQFWDDVENTADATKEPTVAGDAANKGATASQQPAGGEAQAAAQQNPEAAATTANPAEESKGPDNENSAGLVIKAK